LPDTNEIPPRSGHVNMAVEQRQDVAYRGFSGYEDPRYPTGMHLTEGAVIGDASGGDKVLIFDFSTVAAPRNSQYYSLDELRITNFAAAAAVGELAIVNFDSSVTTRFAIELVVTDVAFGSLQLHDYLKRPLFLGRQRSRTAATSISISFNNVDTILLRAYIAGYVWSARSTNVPGGPQRPPTGIYPP